MQIRLEKSPNWSRVNINLPWSYLLALSSNVRSIHWTECVLNGSLTKVIRWRASEQHRSHLMGFRLYGIALEPRIEVMMIICCSTYDNPYRFVRLRMVLQFLWDSLIIECPYTSKSFHSSKWQTRRKKSHDTYFMNWTTKTSKYADHFRIEFTCISLTTNNKCSRKKKRMFLMSDVKSSVLLRRRETRLPENRIYVEYIH